jgi:hypothetical protein
MTQIRLGDLLVRAQVVSEAQLGAALAEQKQWGGRLGTILVRMGVLNEDLLVKALARQLNLPRAAIGPTDTIGVPDAILARVDRATCEKNLILPIGWVTERRSVVVAVADPLNVVALDDFSRRMGARLEIMLAAETQLLQAVGRVFGGSPGVDSRVTGQENGLSFMDNSGRTMQQQQQAGGFSQPPQQAFSQPPQQAFSQQPPQPAFSLPPQPAFSQPPGAAPGWSPQPPTGWTAPPPATPPTMPAPPTTGADDLRVLADQQLRAMRALVELLIERGIISRAELQAWMGASR